MFSFSELLLVNNIDKPPSENGFGAKKQTVGRNDAILTRFAKILILSTLPQKVRFRLTKTPFLQSENTVFRGQKCRFRGMERHLRVVPIGVFTCSAVTYQR